MYSFLKLSDRPLNKHGYPAFLSFLSSRIDELISLPTLIYLDMTKSQLIIFFPFFFFCISCLGRWHYLPLSHSDLKIWSNFSEAYFFLLSPPESSFQALYRLSWPPLLYPRCRHLCRSSFLSLTIQLLSLTSACHLSQPSSWCCQTYSPFILSDFMACFCLELFNT